jgi:hypothetical protein
MERELMNALAKKAPMTTSARARVIAQPFPEYFTQRVAESGFTNNEMAEALGYSKPNVISMIKKGDMKLPVNKVSAAARKLGVDPVFMLEKVLLETAPELWDALREVVGNRMITENEMNLIEYVRRELHGFDANVIAYDGFAKAIQPQLETIRNRESELAKAAKATLERAGRRA